MNIAYFILKTLLHSMTVSVQSIIYLAYPYLEVV